MTPKPINGRGFDGEERGLKHEISREQVITLRTSRRNIISRGACLLVCLIQSKGQECSFESRDVDAGRHRVFRETFSPANKALWEWGESQLKTRQPKTE